MTDHRRYRRLLRLPGPARPRIDAEADEELAFYIESRAEELTSLGLARSDAVRAARAEFGDFDLARRDFARAAADLQSARQRADWWAMIRDDIGRAWQSLRRSPAIGLTAIVMLALGIGANTAIFSVVRGTLLRALPYRDPERLIRVFDIDRIRNTERGRLSVGDYVDYGARHTSLAGLGAFVSSRLTVRAGRSAEQVTGLRITANLLEVLGATPILGRIIRSGEDQERVAVLSYGMWRRMFGGDSSVLGSRLSFNERSYEVVGVMPDEFSLGQGDEYWIPFNDLESTLNDATAARGSRFLHVVARLKPGVSTAQAGQDLSRVARGLEQEHGDSNAGHGVAVVPLRIALTGDATRPLALLAAAAGLVLLIACANLANLLLSRFTSRRRELALLAALGATQRRLIRQTVLESLMLSTAGACLGIALATYGTRALLALSPSALPHIADVRTDAVVLLFTAVVSVLAAMTFGVAPTATVLRKDPAGALRDSGRSQTAGRGARQAQRVLVIVQTSLATMLLIGAGLLIRSSARLRDVDPGFDSRNVVVAGIVLGGNRYDSATAINRFYEALLTDLHATPGVESAAAISALPTAGRGSARLWIDGRPELDANPPTIQTASVTDHYFRTLRIPLLAGRWFTAEDRPGGVPTVVISEKLAATYWRTRVEALGAQVRVGPDGTGSAFTVVGVVGDVRQDALRMPPEPLLYTSYRQARVSDLTVTIRTQLPPSAVNALLRPAVDRIDGAIPLTVARRFDDVLSESVSQDRFLMFLLTIFAGQALVLAASGSYGAARYSVLERMSEFGVRMAIGATRASVIRSVLAHWLTTAVAGLGIGTAVALFATGAIDRQLYEIAPLDPVSFSVAIAVLVLATLIATLEPAIRASRSNPVDVLRRD